MWKRHFGPGNIKANVITPKVQRSKDAAREAAAKDIEQEPTESTEEERLRPKCANSGTLGIRNLLCGFAPLRHCVEVRGRLLGGRGEDFDDMEGGRGAASAAAVAARRRAPDDGPALAKATAGKHACPHAQELITFSRGGKTDWGKKCRFLKIYFNHGSTGWTRIWGTRHEIQDVQQSIVKSQAPQASASARGCGDHC